MGVQSVAQQLGAVDAQGFCPAPGFVGLGVRHADAEHCHTTSIGDPIPTASEGRQRSK
jgi:hypothetical protein